MFEEIRSNLYKQWLEIFKYDQVNKNSNMPLRKTSGILLLKICIANSVIPWCRQNPNPVDLCLTSPEGPL
ncbi:hypothetical protein BH11BAC3_BH11BAC3_18080 [soil metagenome]